MYMLLGLFTWYWKSNYGLEKDLFFVSQQPLMACNSPSRAGFLWDFPIQVVTWTGVIIAQILFKQPYYWDFISLTALLYLEDTTLTQTSCSSSSCYVPLPLWCSLILQKLLEINLTKGALYSYVCISF